MAETAVAVAQAPSLLTKMAHKFGVEPNKMMVTLKATCFKGDVSNEQMMMLLVVADQYGLNPWTKEIYAFPDKGGIVPVVGVDGWSRIVNQHPAFQGVTFAYGPSDDKGNTQWVECTIRRADRAEPCVIREYMAECRRATPPWGSHPNRMLRHKAFMQCARLAMGYVGIYDQDEAEAIIEGQSFTVTESPTIEKINEAIKGPKTVKEAIEQGIAPEVVVLSNTPKTALQQEYATSVPQTAPTYAEIMDWINKAKDDDTVDLAMSMCTGITDGTQYEELEAAAEAKKKALAK